MFSDVNSVLRLDLDSLAGKRVHVSEDEHRLGEFMIHHFISMFEKSGKKVYLISFENTFGHFHTVGLKLGANLVKKRDAEEIFFFDGLKWLSSCDSRIPESFSTIFSSICDKICSQVTNGLIVIDNISFLLKMGFTVGQSAEIMAHLQFLAQETNSTLLSLCSGMIELGKSKRQNLEKRQPSDPEADQLSSIIGHCSHLNIVVWPLPTGKSSSVSGNITFSWMTSKCFGDYQFRIEDKDVKIFAPGTSKGVL